MRDSKRIIRIIGQWARLLSELPQAQFIDLVFTLVDPDAIEYISDETLECLLLNCDPATMNLQNVDESGASANDILLQIQDLWELNPEQDFMHLLSCIFIGLFGSIEYYRAITNEQLMNRITTIVDACNARNKIFK